MNKEGDDDATVQELEAEAKMWEQNARKLDADIERLRDELSHQNLSVTKVNMELASSRLECQDLIREIEQLKSLLEESDRKQNAAEELEFQELGLKNIHKEMEDEIRFLKEENEHLFQQLNKTQESNIELISILHEMEETIEKHRIEIESLTANKSNAANDDQMLSLQCEISFLESAFQEKAIEIKIEEDLRNRVLKEFVLGCNEALAEKEHRIMSLEAALYVDGRKGMKQLKEKVRGLEVDCNELTEENLELLYELNEFRMDVTKSTSNFESEILQEEMVDFEDMESIGKDGIFVSESSSKSVSEAMLITSNLGSHFFDDKIYENNQNELMKLLSDVQQENIYLLQRVSGLEAQLRYFTDESETSRLELQNSESIVRILEDQIKELEEENEAQKVREKVKVYEMEKKWLEAEEARLSLGEVNIRLQSTTENLMEEYNSLQEFNVELREQKLSLQSRCMDLESKARTFQDCCCKYAKSMGNLREKSSQKLENSVFQSDEEENLMIMFRSVMECESKLKSIINELDSKLELSEGERLRLAEENSLLQMRLEKVAQLQKEVLALRVTVQETRSENQKLEASLKFVMRDYEELKRGKVSMAEKIIRLQRSVSKEEDCRGKKNALEDRILRLEGDLIARDGVCVQDAETKNELNQMKIVNSQLLMKVKHLENAREDLQRREREPLEHEAKQTRQDEEICGKSTSESHDSYQPQVQVSLIS